MTKVELLLFTREIRLPGSDLADVQARDTKYDIVMHEEQRIAAVRLKGGKSKTVLVPMENVLCYIEADQTASALTVAPTEAKKASRRK